MDDLAWLYTNSPQGLRRFRILLITYYLIRKILVKEVLHVHARGVKIKSFSIQML